MGLKFRIGRVLGWVYVIDYREATGFAFYGPKWMARLVKRYSSNGFLDTARHESGSCSDRACCA